jgi:hypothetical protein
VKIRLLASVHCDGEAYDEGIVYDVPEATGLELIGLNRAMRERAEAPPAHASSTPEAAEVSVVAERATAKASARKMNRA